MLKSTESERNKVMFMRWLTYPFLSISTVETPITTIVVPSEKR